MQEYQREAMAFKESQSEASKLKQQSDYLLDALKGASNYIDALGGDSKIYHQSIASAEANQ